MYYFEKQCILYIAKQTLYLSLTTEKEDFQQIKKVISIYTLKNIWNKDIEKKKMILKIFLFNFCDM